MMNNNTTNDTLYTLAAEIVTLSRNSLLVNLRFLDVAISRLHQVPTGLIGSFATDGQHLYYSPIHVLKGYQRERNLPARNYLHALFHCIFRHMFVGPAIDREKWDLACDIAVEYSISELSPRAVACSWDAEQQQYFDSLKKALGVLTAEKIYRYFLDGKCTPDQFRTLQAVFRTDDHAVWYDPDSMDGAGSGGGGDSEDDGGPKGNVGRSPRPSGENDPGRQDSQGPAEGSEADWKKISEQIQMDMESFSKQIGDRAGGMLQSLRELNRERYDYAAFLKKFAVRGEVMKINDDEFDYVFYTYGMKVFDRMPLIEPLEYKEEKRVREFVIAIDTSGSTSGRLVQLFLNKTFNILKSTESFFRKVNIHIIQCDAAIQEDAVITSQEELDEYLKHFKIRGLGGTDFRPVFSYVDQLIAKREFTHLKGLIYFTDGCGIFPKRKPDYDSAFVFLKDQYTDYFMPPWAIKLVLEPEDLEQI